MAETIEKLFARAEAAIAEARQLLEINQYLHDRIRRGLEEMHLRTDFSPQTRQLKYPQEIREQRRPYQPFPSKYED